MADRAAGADAAVALAAGLPPLLMAAERVATTVAQGLHGRRRVGVGENFWRFRPHVTGDALSRIDWRQSARADRLYIRETEWDATQTVALWSDTAPGMRWRSAPTLPEKADRAGLLLLALASLLLRGGERIRLLDGADPNAAGMTAGAAALPSLAAALGRATPLLPTALPPAHGAVVLFGDFLGDLAPLQDLLPRIAALPAQGALVQVLDPAEQCLPYAGRTRFVAPAGGLEVLIPRAETVRDAYHRRLEQRRQALAELCAASGLQYIAHCTDEAPETALLALYLALGHRRF